MVVSLFLCRNHLYNKIRYKNTVVNIRRASTSIRNKYRPHKIYLTLCKNLISEKFRIKKAAQEEIHDFQSWSADPYELTVYASPRCQINLVILKPNSQNIWSLWEEFSNVLSFFDNSSQKIHIIKIWLVVYNRLLTIFLFENFSDEKIMEKSTICNG